MNVTVLLEIIFFVLMVVVVFFLTYLLNKHKLKKGKIKNIGEVNYLIVKFNLDSKRLPVKKMLIPISLMDALIMSSTAFFITMLPIKLIWQLLIGFVMLFALIYAVFEIYGRHYVNLGYERKERK